MTVNDVLEKVKIGPAFGGDGDLELIRRAHDFAVLAHAGQKRLSGEPYITHPLAVASRLAGLKLDAPTIAAALLHDVCEDTECTIEELRKEFGEEVASLVEGVTKLDRIRYKGTERSAESLRKMFLAVAEDIRVVLIKLMDRLHNAESIRVFAPDKRKRIALETLEIYAPLAYRLGMKELSGKLEDLSFPHVYPQEYEWLMRTTKEKYHDWEDYIPKVKPVISSELRKDDINLLDIHARAKHYYSLYKKLLKFDMDISKITDIVALRIIVPNVENCYAALGTIHKLWPPLPGKIKDYIALPKPNGYRSLHTTVIGPESRPVEFQIRTVGMHEEAENGIAAHWAYSELKRQNTTAYSEEKPSFAGQRKFAWIEQLREWQKEFEKPDEFLESIKIDFFKDRIFVLTPRGDVFDLPDGATPIDFAYHVHTDVGNRAVGAKVNGKMVAFDCRLRNGDVVEVLTQKNKKPNSDWLKFVKSAHARKKLSSFLRKAEAEGQFDTRKKSKLAELKLTTRNRVGILRDVSEVLARQRINIQSVTSDTKNRALPIITIQAPFRSHPELEKTLVKLKRVKGVEEVEYKLL